jgi:hypothetical protein
MMIPLLQLLLLTMVVLTVLMDALVMVLAPPMAVFAGLIGVMAMTLGVLVINANVLMKLLGWTHLAVRTRLTHFVNVLDAVFVIAPLVTANVFLDTLVLDVAVPLVRMIALDMELANTCLKCVTILGTTLSGLEMRQQEINTTSSSHCFGMLTKLEDVFVILSTLVLIVLFVCVLVVTTRSSSHW